MKPAACSLLVLVSLHAAAQQAPPPARATIDVIAAAPVDSVGLERDAVPATVHSIGVDDGENVVEVLASAVPSVQFNDAQHNPLQRDVQLRGFTASPLLGLPQGVAVYSDGVRVNEPFGDVVNWDLLPDVAIERIDVLTGSNPIFGLNALGGALSVRTKTGVAHSGVAANVVSDSLGATRVEADGGASSGSWHAYGAASVMHDEGWRMVSESRAAQLFGKAGRLSSRAVLELTAAGAQTRLRGNGPAPVQLVAVDRRAVFTHPDITRNRALNVQTRGDWQMAPDVVAEANAYVRTIDTRRLNGDDSPFEPCEATPSLLCEEDDDDPVLTIAGEPLRAVIDGMEVNAANHSSRTRTRTIGATTQLHADRRFAAARHRLLFGIAADRSSIAFNAATEAATLTDDRGTRGHGIEVADAAVHLDSTTRSLGLYARDTISIGERATLSIALRHQRTNLDLRDRFGTELNGSHEFARVNASLGGTWRIASGAVLFASAGESSRAPTPVELTCADPDDPCRLPNAFVSDPPLEQVVVRTYEIGARGERRSTRWSAAAFASANRDDIIFVASGTTQGEGYFANVGTTSRRGAEVMIESRAGSTVRWRFGHAFLDARFGTALVLPSRNHPLAEDGAIEVERGDRLPGLAAHTSTLLVDLDVSPALRATVGTRYQSSQFFRGDEANLLDPLAGFAVVDARLDWSASRRVAVTLAVDNLLGRDYATFGVLGDAEDVLGDHFGDPRFISAAAPRAWRLGVRLRLR